MDSVNFDRAAEYYDATRALPAEVMAALTGVLVAELAPARQPCLEIGVGTGRIALPLHGRGIRLAGADIAEAMLRRLVVNADGVLPFPLLLADATRLPVADGTFGSVLAVHVLHLIPAWRDALRWAGPCADSSSSCTRGPGPSPVSRCSAPPPTSARGRPARTSRSLRSTGSRIPSNGGRSSGSRDPARCGRPGPVRRGRG